MEARIREWITLCLQLSLTKSRNMELKERVNGSKWWMVLVGILLLPIALALFIVDRFVMVFLVMSDAPTIKNYFEDIEYIFISALRSLILAIIIITINWLCF